MHNYHSYTSEFYEPNVQEVVESNRSVFELEADAVTEGLENIRNNQGNIIYSFDPINDQEDSDLQRNSKFRGHISWKKHLMNNRLQT